MGTNLTPKPSLLRRVLRSIRSLLQEQGDVNERRNAEAAQGGSYGIGRGPRPGF